MAETKSSEKETATAPPAASEKAAAVPKEPPRETTPEALGGGTYIDGKLVEPPTKPRPQLTKEIEALEAEIARKEA